jgi:porin
MVSAVLPTRIGGLRGYHAVTVYLTSASANNAEDDSDAIPPPGSGVLLPTGSGGMHLRYAVQQYHWQDPANPKRGWGFLGYTDVSTGVPGILRWNMAAGVAGSVPVRTRPLDRFGVGYFRFSLTDRLVDGLAPAFRLRDEQGIEVYYTAQADRRVRLTVDGQLIDPVFATAPLAVYLGLRVKTDF